MGLKTLLDEEIRDEFEELGKMDLGNDQYRTTVDGLTKLIDRRIELDRVEHEHKEKIESRDIETELRIAQMEDEKKDRKVKNGIAVAGFVLPVAVTVWGTITSLKFEETGSVSSIMGRGFIQKLLPKLK